MSDTSHALSLVDKTAARIIKYITDNNLQPGEKLPTESSFIQILHVGRGTLREAIKQLNSRNVLESRQGSGTYVSDKRGIPQDPLGLTFLKNDPSLVRDLIDVRLMFEPEIAALAAHAATPAQIAEIEHCCTVVEQLIDAGKPYDEEDLAFHSSIAKASGNLVVVNLVPIIYTSIRSSILATSNSLSKETRIYHRKCMEAIKAHDMAGARYAMLMHLIINRNHRFSDNLQELHK
ncbi:FadR/GntR family transcriptional regulator [Selenomonas sp. TAMA-11512]|uniref:FadR/GntR family transcriptional regulator n=1 Tax=Selenomonas sp. TAMA-11512 TaxID=3095337 RepID=UPI0030D43A73